MPAATGADLGVVSKILKKVVFTGALVSQLKIRSLCMLEMRVLFLNPVEERSVKALILDSDGRPLSSLFIYGDLNTCKAKSVDDEEGSNNIPLAPTTTMTGGMSAQILDQLNVGFRFNTIPGIRVAKTTQLLQRVIQWLMS